jgi:hypothetical protein
VAVAPLSVQRSMVVPVMTMVLRVRVRVGGQRLVQLVRGVVLREERQPRGEDGDGQNPYQHGVTNAALPAAPAPCAHHPPGRARPAETRSICKGDAGLLLIRQHAASNGGTRGLTTPPRHRRLAGSLSRPPHG